MPHLILEVSSNLADTINYSALFSDLHQLLSIRLPTEISSCKSRLISHERYYLAQGKELDGFIHLTLKVLPGREEQKLAEICRDILARLTSHSKTTWPFLLIATSIELIELGPLYFKN